MCKNVVSYYSNVATLSFWEKHQFCWVQEGQKKEKRGLPRFIPHFQSNDVMNNINFIIFMEKGLVKR